MPISHFSKVFAVKDIKLWPLTADPSGGSATYGTGIDVPGAKTLNIEGTIDTKQLRGDNGPLDQASVMSEVKATIEFAKISLDILAAVFSAAAVVDSGTTPNQKAAWTLTGSSGFNYVGITGQSISADVITGSADFAVYKAMISSPPPMGLAEEDYKTSSIEFGCVPLLATGNKWIGATLFETTAALAAPA